MEREIELGVSHRLPNEPTTRDAGRVASYTQRISNTLPSSTAMRPHSHSMGWDGTSGSAGSK